MSPPVCSAGVDQPLGISERRQPDGSTVLALVGELDIAGVDRVGERLARLQRTRTPTVVDLSALTFTDCAGVGVLTTARARARSDPAWDLEFGPQMTPQVQRLITFVAAVSDSASVTDAKRALG